MKILITGGAGFIGSHLIDGLLAKGHKAVCVDDLSLGKERNINHLKKNTNFKFIRLNMLNSQKLDRIFKANKFECVFHLAANSDLRQSLRSPSADLQNTFMTTYSVLNCMRNNNVRKIVFTSSSAVYGKLDTLLYEDTGPLLPISLYGAAKLASEAFISAFCENYGMQAWILRFPNAVGERATHGVVFDFIKQLKKNPKKLIILGDGNQKKPYVYVKDLVKGILFAWRNASDKLNYFNLGVDSSTTVKKVAKIITEEMGCKKTKLIYTGGKRGWVGDVPKYIYDLKKINKLGWKVKISSDEAIRIAVREILKKISVGK